MKLRAPHGVGDPCVAGVTIAPRDGFYEVEPEVGALLIECFGFIEAGAHERKATIAPRPSRRGRFAATRREVGPTRPPPRD